ncbi:MAG: hypothetical protein ACKOYM_06275 [Actinomycetes bacterium]
MDPVVTPGTLQTCQNAPMVDERVDFDCPRCGTSVAEPFYGPCGTCRSTLRASVAGDARNLDAPAYEPKMNVTPNAVALKD